MADFALTCAHIEVDESKGGERDFVRSFIYIICNIKLLHRI